ncbi:MAG: Asp-tRNA(Asn)/Glu-tRNA(Gln) amidotransferase subunit GatC [Candidatus Micrarchaeaceae archaeon]
MDLADYWKIDKKLIEHVCAMAKLEPTEKERGEYLRQISDVLEAFKVLKEIDAENGPAFHPVGIENVWREDKVVKTKWDPLGNTKNKEQGYFKGPKIV